MRFASSGFLAPFRHCERSEATQGRRAGSWVASTLALLAMTTGVEAVPAAPPPIRLAPHRAVYDLSLASSRGMRGLDGARGRIAFDFTGNACEGYALKFRQVTVVDSAETGSKTSDLRTASFESGDGKTFRFRNDSTTIGGPKTLVDGSAEKRAGGGLAVKLRSPKRQSVALGDDAVFPNAQMRDLIAAAREGRHVVPMKLFDGSDDGHKVYETLAILGDAIEPGTGEGLEPAAKQDGLAKLRRWPVTVSYFSTGRADATPSYVLGFELYDNGVSRALRLDYGDFVLKGEMVRLDLLPEPACPR